MIFSPYLGVILFALCIAGFLVAMLVLSSVLGPKNPTRTKQLPFECGAVSVGAAREQRFNVRFYLVAMLFVLFDIEIIFMYPWAAVLTEIGWPGFFSMLTFMLVLAVGLIFIWKKKVLDWNSF
jgi:NADH-quinone oxidoreductase subunit A